MPDVDLTYHVGTCSVGVGDTTVVGVATLWAQSANVRQWDLISIDGGPLVPIVASAVDDTHIPIPAWTGAAKAGVTYVIYQVSPLRFVGGQAMADVDDMLAKLNTDGWYRYVNPAFAGPTEQGIVANDGQFALKASTKQIWEMIGGVWVLLGTFAPLGTAAPYDNAHTYSINDVATLNGSSYVWINATPGSGHVPPNATFWQVLASVGATGPATLLPIAAWATGVAMVAGPPASYVSQGGSSYECLISHTSGVFATDLAAGKWGLVAQAAPTYGGSSATSLAIAVASKDFTDVPLTLAYQVSNYVRASSAASGANYMEGFLTAYSAGHFTINVQKIGGTGTHTDWRFSISGAPGSGDMLAANFGSEYVGHEAAVAANLGVVSYAASQALTASQRAQVRTDISAPLRGHISNLALSMAGASATFFVSIGECADSTAVDLLALVSAYSKTTSAWAVGSGNGALDGGTIAANTWYHVFLIKRPDTGVVDVLVGLSPTAPGLPSGYTLFRRIGSMRTDASSQWRKFNQLGDEFLWSTTVDGDATASALSSQSVALTVPSGIQVIAIFSGYTSSATSNNEVKISSLDQADTAPDAAQSIQGSGTSTFVGLGMLRVRTDTSRQVRARSQNSCALRLSTFGWIDDRGKNA